MSKGPQLKGKLIGEKEILTREEALADPLRDGHEGKCDRGGGARAGTSPSRAPR